MSAAPSGRADAGERSSFPPPNAFASTAVEATAATVATTTFTNRQSLRPGGGGRCRPDRSLRDPLYIGSPGPLVTRSRKRLQAACDDRNSCRPLHRGRERSASAGPAPRRPALVFAARGAGARERRRQLRGREATMTSRFHWVAAIAMTAALSGATAAQASTAWITQAEPVYPRPGLDLSPPDSSDPFGVW